MTQKSVIKIAMVDDHVLLRSALARFINSFENCSVIHQANNGKELIEKLNEGELLDMVLLDLNMPVMDGMETAAWLRNNHKDILTVMLTMYDSDIVLIRLLQLCVRGFLKKYIEPLELEFAIRSIYKNGYYYSMDTAQKLAGMFRNEPYLKPAMKQNMLEEKEITFLKLASSEFTYKEIAVQMEMTVRNVDSIRDGLFTKLNIKSRVGLAIFAIRNGIVSFS